MEIIKIITFAILGTILLLGLIILIHSLPALFMWLSEQIGFITTMALLILVICLISKSK
jgi:hypothetical protein